MFFGDTGVDDVIHLTLQNGIKAEVAAEAVIGHPVVFGVVGADFFAAISRSHLGAPCRSFAGIRLSELAFIELGAQNLKGAFAVLHLRALLGAKHPDASWFVHEVNCRLDFVHVLATSTARPGGADVEVAGVDLHLNGISLWHHGNRGR